MKLEKMCVQREVTIKILLNLQVPMLNFEMNGEKMRANNCVFFF